VAFKGVVFDMDGVIVDSEPYWEESRGRYALTHGFEWGQSDEVQVKGNNSKEWSAAMARKSGRKGALAVERGVIDMMRRRFQRHLPLRSGTQRCVRTLARHYRLAVASSSPRELITFVLQAAGLIDLVEAAVSSDEVEQGKPAPDVFRAALRALDLGPRQAVAVEDSAGGIRSARAAGLRVIAVPPRHSPLPPEVSRLASLVLTSPGAITLRRLRELER
jgi:beta-phosphoglucomutase-like phosphatase (HAD superfamily)